MSKQCQPVYLQYIISCILASDICFVIFSVIYKIHVFTRICTYVIDLYVKVHCPGLKQFLTTENFLKMLRCFSFHVKSSFCPDFVVMQEDDLIVNFKIYDVTDCTANYCNTYILQYLPKQRQSGNENQSVNKI